MPVRTSKSRADAVFRRLDALRDRFPAGGWVRWQGLGRLVSVVDVRELLRDLELDGRVEKRTVMGEYQWRAEEMSDGQ